MRKKGQKNQVFLKKKLSETVEVKEKSSWRRWKSKNFGELLINQVFDKKRSKKLGFFEKKALRDGGSQRKKLSETVKVQEKRSRRRWKSKNFEAYKPWF